MLRIINYTPATILVVGDTYTHRAPLKAAGGKWQARLYGWLFRSERREEIADLVKSLDSEADIEEIGK